MAKKTHTKDEKFVICLYEAAEKTGEMETVFDRYEIGTRVGLQKSAVDAIAKLLVQTNFIKKSGENGIYITPHGQSLALRLLDEV